MCAICWLKPKRLINISNETLDNIRVFVNESYSLDDWMPTVICDTCRRRLIDRAANKDVTLHHVDYSNLSSPVILTRGRDVCECSLCVVGRMNFIEYTEYKKRNSAPPVGRPPSISLSPQREAGKLTVCNACMSEIGRGLPHQCSETSLRENTANLGKYLKSE